MFIPSADLSIPIVVKFSDYWKPMLDYDTMKISAFVSDKNNLDANYMAENDVVLKDPPLKVTVSKTSTQNYSFYSFHCRCHYLIVCVALDSSKNQFFRPLGDILTTAYYGHIGNITTRE